MSEQDRQSHNCSEQSTKAQPASKREVNSLLRIVRHLSYEVAKMAMSLDALTTQVAKSVEVEQSAIVLIRGIAQALKDAAGDPAAVNALRIQLETSADALAAAVVENTQSA